MLGINHPRSQLARAINSGLRAIGGEYVPGKLAPVRVRQALFSSRAIIETFITSGPRLEQVMFVSSTWFGLKKELYHVKISEIITGLPGNALDVGALLRSEAKRAVEKYCDAISEEMSNSTDVVFSMPDTYAAGETSITGTGHRACHCPSCGLRLKMTVKWINAILARGKIHCPCCQKKMFVTNENPVPNPQPTA